MSNQSAARQTGDSSESSDDLADASSHSTTVVRADSPGDGARERHDLHPLLRSLLGELYRRTGSQTLDIELVLRAVSRHFHALDAERRGIVQSMRLMADEAEAIAQARQQSSEHLRIILDHIKDVVLTVDEEGVIQTFNPTGERVFGYGATEVIGKPIEMLMPRIVKGLSIGQSLRRLAATSEDTAADLTSRECHGTRKSGARFPAEIAVSQAQINGRQVFVVCLRDVTERHESIQAMRESEARYRMLIDHAPEAIVVIDADVERFVDGNENAERLFELHHLQLAQLGLADVSPALQPDGSESRERAKAVVQRALDGEPQVLEWLFRSASGREIMCEIRLVRLPSATRRLVRGSIADISERKRAENVAAAEREVFEQLTANAPLPEVLGATARIIESLSPDAVCAVSMLGESGQSFSLLVAPHLPEALCEVLRNARPAAHEGTCAAAAHLGREVVSADVRADSLWQGHRDILDAAGIRSTWSTPMKAANGRVLGALGVYRAESGVPTPREREVVAHAAQLAGIAIERRFAEEALRSSEARFRGLFESIAEGVYQSDIDGRLLSVNPAFVSILGYESADELYALPSAAALYWNATDRAEFARRLELEGEIRNAEFLMRRRDGQQIVILENSRVVRDAGGRAVGYEGTIVDITERKRAEQAIFAEKERAQVTLQSIGDAVISTDSQGRIEYINPVAETLTGWSVDEARGRPIGEVLNLVNELSREPVASPLLRALGRAPEDDMQQPVLVTRSGKEIAIQESAAPICDRQGRIIGAVIVFHDVTQERRLKRALSYQASHDALTGLINRREFDHRLQQAVGSAQRNEGSYSLLYIDLDQFKLVNDTCGHPAGDRLLRDITGLLQLRVRASDTIARLGGDEFGILLECCSLEQATRIAESIRQSIRDYRFVWGATTLSIGASIGIVQIGPGTESVASVMSAADIACYAAKDEGRNRIHIYEAEGTSSRQREMHWVAHLTRAAEENRFELFHQPIVPIGAGGASDFHEITIRLRDHDGLLVPPDEFIPAAERYNVMPIIDRWVVLRAMELLQEHRHRGLPLPQLAVNLSGTSLNDQAFIDFVLQLTNEPALAAALCFEITETAAVTNLSNAIYFMRELKARGCKFALDDFGSGLSSFMYLRTLPVDFLKIDGQFVGQIATNPVDRSMVEAICKVGRALGIHTIAECVESADVLEELGRIHVDYAQGFHIARPQPISRLLER